MSEKKGNKAHLIRMDKLTRGLIILACVVILFSLVAPWLFVQKSGSDGMNFNNTGPIGDTIGGIMNPFIAIAGITITFLAFYIQFKANRLQYQNFRDELDEQKRQFRKTQVENQFYEMLRLHKENVAEISLVITKEIREGTITKFIEYPISGRPVFEYLKKEFELCYSVAKIHFRGEKTKKIINEAFGVFYHGLNDEIIGKHPYFRELDHIRNQYEHSRFQRLGSIVTNITKLYYKEELGFPLFGGYSALLAHYHRHLFQTVKFIANQPDELLTYEEKRNYLRILRAQLSNQEQALIFYNWMSRFGHKWEDDQNKFFTDYRMVHNLYNELLISDVNLLEIPEFKRNFKKEKDRKKDPLFEFEDWL